MNRLFLSSAGRPPNLPSPAAAPSSHSRPARFACGLLAAWVSVATSLATVGTPAHAADVLPAATATSTMPTLAVPAVEERILKFSQLSGQKSVALRTSDGRETLNFGVRRDEIVTRALLRLRYTYSPALIPTQSHIKLSMNGELLGVVPITKEDAGKKMLFETEIDPRLLSDFNNFGMQFIGHYANECEDPVHSSLWTDVSGASEIVLSVQRLAPASDLAILPEPFFDRRDNSRLNLNFLFGAKPARTTLQAAAVTASWFGKLASYRGARFPTAFNTIPPGHAVVFAPNDERPAVLASLAPATGPGLLVMVNPSDPAAKLLVLTGRNGEDIRQAAEALSLGNLIMSGSQLGIKEGVHAAPRAAYDAPNWVRMDRPMRFSEVVNSPQELQVFGHEPPPISINLRIPPDLFTWRSKGVPLDLKYRYSPPSRSSESRLTMRINNEFVQAFSLVPGSVPGESARVRLPVLEDGLLSAQQSVLIPAFKLGIRNSLQYGFSFTYLKENNCRDTQVDNLSAMIDADSKIDFSGLPNYAEMPNLGFFASSGFPFTKFADLAQTVVVLPEQPSAIDVQTMLALMGRMGESTGAVATRVRLAGPGDEAALKDADLLLVGVMPQQTLLGKWGTQLPAGVLGASKRMSNPVHAMSSVFAWFGMDVKPDATIASQQNVEGNGPLAMMLGFESPLSSGRSVVAVTASAPQLMGQVLDTLDDSTRLPSIRGSAVFIRGQQVDSILASTTYTVGSLPFWTSIWYGMSEHPILLALAAVIAVLILAFALWRGLRAVAARRSGGGA
ncbi:MAG: cellulose biosynthesis cyclic di-GMP-binding regulatory protein BcsB [Herminiimonas sp.]|nr:cellulose biosynthesis cyclic di-GMP-binding regulatory protein BcsB [Herminiimonas sp.]